jgi:hypothetical protein
MTRDGGGFSATNVSFEVVDDPVHGGIIRDEGHDLHRAPALGTDQAHPLEDARFVHPAPGHQKMQARVKIDPVPEGLDDGDNAGRKCLIALTSFFLRAISRMSWS